LNSFFIYFFVIRQKIEKEKNLFKIYLYAFLEKN